MTVLAKREIAVDTEKAIPFFGEAVLLQPRVEPRSATFGFSINPSISVDVVNRQELEMRVPATLALPAVGSDNALLQFNVVVAKVFLTLAAFLLLCQNFLPIFSVVFPTVLLLLIGIFGVVILAPLFLLFSIRGIEIRVLALPVIRMRFLEFLHGSTAGWGIFNHLLNHSTPLLKECQHGVRNWYWYKYTASAVSEHRQLVLGGSRQQCRDEKFSLIDLDAAMQTGRKAEVCHRERLSERTPFWGGAIVWAYGN